MFIQVNKKNGMRLGVLIPQGNSGHSNKHNDVLKQGGV